MSEATEHAASALPPTLGEFRTSNTIGALTEALVAAEKSFGDVRRDRPVKVATKDKGSYTFRYATLPEVVDATRPALLDQGLVVVQMPTTVGRQVMLITRLMHKSGEWLEAGIPVVPTAPGPQPLGSAITYMRRYAYTALLGIAADNDDDGNAAHGNRVEYGRDRHDSRRDREAHPASEDHPSYASEAASPTTEYPPDVQTPYCVVTPSEGEKDLRTADDLVKWWRARVNGWVKIKALDKLEASVKANEAILAELEGTDERSHPDCAAYIRKLIAWGRDKLADDNEAKRPAPGITATPEDYLAASVQRINTCSTTDELQQIRDTLYTGEAFENLPAGDKLYLGLEADARRLELRIAEAKDRAALSALTHDKVHVALLRELPADRVAAIKKLADDRWAKLPEADEPARKGTSTATQNVAANGELTDEQWVDALIREIKAAKSDAQAKAFETQAPRKARLNRIKRENPALAQRVEDARDDRIAALAQGRAAA